jgi:hypothetical protein
VFIDWDLWKDSASSMFAYKMYPDQFSKPMLISTYNAGDVFKVNVRFDWFNSQAKDYTVKIYSKATSVIKNRDGNTSVKHMDGQSPSGFTNS